MLPQAANGGRPGGAPGSTAGSGQSSGSSGGAFAALAAAAAAAAASAGAAGPGGRGPSGSPTLSGVAGPKGVSAKPLDALGGVQPLRSLSHTSGGSGSSGAPPRHTNSSMNLLAAEQALKASSGNNYVSSIMGGSAGVQGSHILPSHRSSGSDSSRSSSSSERIHTVVPASMESVPSSMDLMEAGITQRSRARGKGLAASDSMGSPVGSTSRLAAGQRSGRTPSPDSAAASSGELPHMPSARAMVAGTAIMASMAMARTLSRPAMALAASNRAGARTSPPAAPPQHLGNPNYKGSHSGDYSGALVQVGTSGGVAEDSLATLLSMLAEADAEDERGGADPMDSARSDLAARMGRVALEAVLRNMTFVVSTKVAGTFGWVDMDAQEAAAAAAAASAAQLSAESAAASAAAEAEAKVKADAEAKRKQREKVAAERLAKQKEEAMKEQEKKKKAAAARQELSPLLVFERQRAAEREARRNEQRTIKRAKALEREKANEARERSLMNAEEWIGERAKWVKVYGGREGGWRTVRVFISSTFTDMHGERDSLTRSVFPTLNNYAKSRRVRVVPIDLRWGLTSEDTSDTGLGALEHCLLEVDHSRPFFLLLMGERYGWIPPNYRVSDRPEFDWVHNFELGHSITDMEIQYGFMRKYFTPVHAYCFKRDPAFMAEIPDYATMERRIFSFDYTGDEVVTKRRDDMRAAIEAHPYCQSRVYTCKYGGLDEEGKPHVTALGAFESKVLEDLWDAIQAEFPQPPPPPSALEYERAFHMHFVLDKSHGFIGRRGILEELRAYADGEDATGANAAANGNGGLPLVLIGTAGSGKTSLIAAFTKQYIDSHPRVFVLVHVVSASPSSTDIRESLLRICRELSAGYALDFGEEDLDDYQAVKDTFFTILARAGEAARKAGTHIVMLIDAINQLSPFNGAMSMDWLPTLLPLGVRLILSSVPDAECTIALAKRDPRPPTKELPGLSNSEREDIVRQQLSEYRKKLTREQIRLLLDKKESAKPLYLLTACEELRLQAQYGAGGSGVDDKIRELPGEIPALLDVTLDRVERDLATWAKTSAAQALLPDPSSVASPAGDSGAADPARAGEDGEEEEAESKDDGAAKKSKSKRRAGAAEGDDDGDEDDDGGRAVTAPADKLFRDDLTDPDLIGRAIVRKALALLVCSRHGLQESELLELLAPRGKKMLPPVVWARLYRSLELYLHPMGQEEDGMLGFFHMQMIQSVKKRYLHNNRLREAEVCGRLAAYFVLKADPNGDGTYSGEQRRYFEDLVFYHLRALNVGAIRGILGSIIFIEKRARHGTGAMEHLLRDYHGAQEEIRLLKLSHLKSMLSKADFNRFSRAAVLSWLTEFMVFCSSHHTQLTAFPNLTFQYALNQPNISGPAVEAQAQLARALVNVDARMDARERRATDRAEAAIWALLCSRYQDIIATYTGHADVVSEQATAVARRMAAAKAASKGKATDAAGAGGQRRSSVTKGGAAAGNTQAVVESIAEPNAWLALCARQFGAPKPGFVNSIAFYLSKTMAAATAQGMAARDGTVPLASPSAAGQQNVQAIVSVFVSALQSQVNASLAAQATPRGTPTMPPLPAPATHSVVYMTTDEAGSLGVPPRALRAVRAALAEDLATLSLGISVDLVPRRYLEWVNKPQRNRIVADFAGLHSQVTCLALSPDASVVALGFKSSHAHLVDAGTGEIMRELVTNGHSEGITCLAFSVDGLRLVTGSHDTLLITWDALTGSRLAHFGVHTGSVTAAVFIEAGEGGMGGAAGGREGGGAAAGNKARRRGARTLASASMEGDIRISQEKRAGAGRYGADGGDGSSDSRYEEIWAKDFMASPIMCLAYNQVVQYLVGGHGDGDITVWDAHAPNLGLIELAKFKAHKFSSVMCLDLSPDGNNMATGGADATLRLWRRVILGPDVFWKEDAATEGDKSGGGGHQGQITAVHFSPDGSRLLTSGLDKKLILWEVESVTEILSMAGHSEAIYASAFLGAENRVISGSYDKTVKVWDVGGVDDRRSSAPVKRAGITHMHASIGRTRGGAARGAFGGLARGSQAPQPAPSPKSGESGTSGGTRRISAGTSGGSGVSSPHAAGDTPIVGTDGGKVFFPETGGAAAGQAKRGKNTAFGRRTFGLRQALAMQADEPHTPHAPAGSHSDRVLAIVVSLDGKIAVTGGADKEIKVWDIAKGQESCVLLGHHAAVTALCLTHDQRLLLSGDASGVLMLWDGMTFDHLHTVTAHRSGISAITYAVVHPPPNGPSHGLVIFSGTVDGQIRAWQASSGAPWEIQPPEPTGEFLRRSAIKALQFVPATSTPTPPTAAAAPVDTGVFPADMERIRALERGHRNRRRSTDGGPAMGSPGADNDVDYASPTETGGAGGQGKGGAVLAGKRGRGRGRSVPARGRKGGGRGGKDVNEGGIATGPAEPAQTAKQVTDANIYRVDRLAEKPDPPVTLEGVSAAHSRPRLVIITADGHSAILDVFTMHILHHDIAPSELGMLAAAALTPDGTRVALASAIPTTKPVVIAPGASLLQAVPAVLELPGQLKRSGRDGDRDKAKGGEGGLAPLNGPAVDAKEAKRLAEEKLQADLKRYEEKKKRREERRAARRAEKAKKREARLNAVSKLKNSGKGMSEQEIAAIVGVSDDDEDDDDDDEEETKADTQGAKAPGAPGAGGEGTQRSTDDEVDADQNNASRADESNLTSDKLVSSVALSYDGTLLAAGCTERLLCIMDAARPNLGPLAQFLAYGEVTAVAVGPGVMPWAKGPVSGDAIAEAGDQPALGVDGQPVSPGLSSAFGGLGTGTTSVPKLQAAPTESRATQRRNSRDGAAGDDGGDGGGTKNSARSANSGSDADEDGGEGAAFDALRFHSSRVGDGDGHIGVIVAGDSTGALFILRLTDVLRRAECERQRKALEQEAKRRAEAEAKARLEEEARKAAEAERKRLEALKEAAKGKMEKVEFATTGVTATAVYVPRVMNSSQAADRELADDILRSLGVALDELSIDEVAPEDAEILLQQIGLTAAPARPSTTAVAARSADAADAALAASPAGKAKGKGGKATGKAMANLSKGGRGAAFSASIDEDEEEPTEEEIKAAKLAELREEYWARPRCLVGVFGGAGGLHDLLVPNLRRLIKRGAVAAALMSGGMILDGGTSAGVMEMVGSSIHNLDPHTLRILGVSPAALVLKPGEKSSDPNAANLEPHHPNFIMVPAAEWGGETSTMFCFAHVVAKRVPAVAVLANGGMISKKEILNAVRHHIPVVVIEGSGRLADQIARAMHRRDETPPEEWASVKNILVPDPDTLEIMSDGDLRLFNVTGQGEALRIVLMDILQAQRDKLLLAQLENEADPSAAEHAAPTVISGTLAGAKGGKA